MKATTCLFAVLIALAGCARATLPFKPLSQPSGLTLSADYVVLADRLRVEVDTDSYRLEDAQLTRLDNVSVRPLTIEVPPPASAGGSSIGFGIGGGSVSGGRGGAVGVGSGVGVTIPMGSDTRVAGNTVLYFALDQVGQPPWRLTVTVAGAPTDIMLLPKTAAK
jgi:hypothetical protein